MIKVTVNSDFAWVMNECVVFGGDLYVLKVNIWRLVPIDDYVTTVCIQFEEDEWLSVHTKKGERWKVYRNPADVKVIHPNGASDRYYFSDLNNPDEETKNILDSIRDKDLIDVDYKDFVLFDGRLHVNINGEWVYINYLSDFTKVYTEDDKSIIVETKYDSAYKLVFEESGIRWLIHGRRPDAVLVVAGFDKYGMLFERNRRETLENRKQGSVVEFLNRYSGAAIGRKDIIKEVENHE